MASNMDNPSKPPHGVYKNPRLMHASTTIVGSTVHLQTVSGSIWEGIFNTFNPEFTICLKLAIEIDPKLNRKDNLYAALKAGKSVQQQAFFDLKDIVRISVVDVDINSASIDQTKLTTDTDISGYDAGKSAAGSKQLETWQDDDGDNANEDSMLSLDEVALTSNKNDIQTNNRGWDAKEMFSYNERVHKVTTTYDEKLTDYTVPLPKHSTKDWVKKNERAAIIAKEIEGNTKSQSRLAKEDEGDCEEEKFSAVVRPAPQTRPAPSSNNMMHKNFRPRPNYDRSRVERIDSLKNFSNKLVIGSSPRQPQQQSQKQHPQQAQSQHQHQQHQQHHQHQPQQHHQQQHQPPSQKQHQQPSQLHQNQQSHQPPSQQSHQQTQPQHQQHTQQQPPPPQHQQQQQQHQPPQSQQQHLQHQHPQQQPQAAQQQQQSQNQPQSQSTTQATTLATSTQQSQTQSADTTASPATATTSSVNTSTMSERSDSSSLGSQAKDHQSELARKSKLNPNAKEFVYKPSQGAQTNQISGAPAVDPNNSSPMTQAYYQQVPIFPHGLSPQQQHHAAQFIPHPYMTPQYIRGNFQNYNHRGEHHNNMRPDYPQASMMVPTTAGQPFVPPPSGAPPHPMNAYAASPQQQMIYHNGQSMYPIPPQNWPRFWLDGGFW